MDVLVSALWSLALEEALIGMGEFPLISSVSASSHRIYGPLLQLYVSCPGSFCSRERPAHCRAASFHCVPLVPQLINFLRPISSTSFSLYF